MKELEGLLDRYRLARNCAIQGTTFHSPLELLAAVERDVRFDILFLDILMPGENGIEAAEEIRNYDSNVKIIFLTSSPEFAVQSYRVGAYFYLLKPLREEHFFLLMDSVLEACRKEQSDGLVLRCKSGVTRIELKRLEYCEVLHRTLFFHLDSGKVLESPGSLDELCDRLSSYRNFIRPHRSYLINLDHVQRISSHAIMMSCLTEIPLPRGKYNEIKNAFLEHAFENGQVML